MANSKETGHATNVANFNVLAGLCAGYGETYNPSTATLKLKSLKTLLANAEASMAEIKAAKADFDRATNDRERTFKTLKMIATNVVNMLASTEASQLTINDAQVAKRKLGGLRATDKNKPEATNNESAPGEGKATTEGVQGDEAAYRSVSQIGFNYQVENFEALVNVVAKEPLYKPNEEDLTVESLTALVANLRDLNKAVANAEHALKDARTERNNLLYAPRTGMYDITMAVKKYIRGVFGTTSVQAKNAGKIKFTNFDRSKRKRD